MAASILSTATDKAALLEVAAGVDDHPLDEFLEDCDIVLALQAYRGVLIEGAYEADYDGDSLAHLWGPRIGSLLCEEPPDR